MPSNASTKSKRSKTNKNTKLGVSTRSSRSGSAASIATVDEPFPEIVQVQADVHSAGDDRSMRQPTVKGKDNITQSDGDSDGDSEGDSEGEGPHIHTGHGVPRLRYFHKLQDRPSLKK